MTTKINMLEFKRHHGIRDSVRNRAAVNMAIRKNMPGGAEILAVIERLAQMQHGRRGTPDPVLQDMLDTLMSAREYMAEALFAGFRASRAVPEKNKGGPPLTENRIDYSKVDWSKADATLGRELGVTRQAIAGQRKRYAGRVD